MITSIINESIKGKENELWVIECTSDSYPASTKFRVDVVSEFIDCYEDESLQSTTIGMADNIRFNFFEAKKEFFEFIGRAIWKSCNDLKKSFDPERVKYDYEIIDGGGILFVSLKIIGVIGASMRYQKLLLALPTHISDTDIKIVISRTMAYFKSSIK